MPESEHLGHGDEYRKGRKAFAKYVVIHGTQAQCSFEEAFEATKLMLEAGDLVFADVKAKSGKRLELLHKSELGEESE